QPPQPKDKPAVAPAPPPGIMPPPRGAAPVAVPPAPARPPVIVVYVPYRFVVYPWVATAPRCHHWWQTPWYAAPWWGYPWSTYWSVPGYQPTPWGYWSLSPWNYWAYWQTPGFGPAHVPYHRTVLQHERPVEPIAANRSAESLYLEGFDRYFDGQAGAAQRLLN